jgi:putative membrane protein
LDGVYWDHGMSGWGFGFMALNLVVFWAILIGAGLLLYRAIRRTDAQRAAGSPGSPPAERILAERYARGEIDDDEYRRRLETLRRG